MDKPRLYLNEYKLKQDPNDCGISDELWDFEKFKKSMKIVIVKYNEEEIEFDMIGVSPAVANSFRRLMLSEVPSMAIEKVHIYNNTSIIQDEVLAHRLGLIPLKANPLLFEYKANDNEAANELTTLEFELKIKCTRKNKEITEVTSNDQMYKNHNVYSGSIKWIPIGKQASIYKEIDVGPINNDILISKMRPGHEFDLKLFAVKGIGKDHAKFSPVATASYRLLPDVQLNRDVSGRDARLLQKCFSPGVIEIDKEDRAYVKDARYDSCSRNVYRYPQLADAVTLSRIRNHFVFNVESLGALKPEEIFIESVKCLKKKCQMFLEMLE
jgi:DNA-directed RNA polymerase I and III subunit RPAC1